MDLPLPSRQTLMASELNDDDLVDYEEVCPALTKPPLLCYSHVSHAVTFWVSCPQDDVGAEEAKPSEEVKK